MVMVCVSGMSGLSVCALQRFKSSTPVCLCSCAPSVSVCVCLCVLFGFLRTFRVRTNIFPVCE